MASRHTRRAKIKLYWALVDQALHGELTPSERHLLFYLGKDKDIEAEIERVRRQTKA